MNDLKNQKLQTFIAQAGFKNLAMSRLSEVEYSLVLYIVNAAFSDFAELITNEHELSSLIGYPEKSLQKAIDRLIQKKIIKVRYPSQVQKFSNGRNESLSISVELDASKWELDFDQGVSSQDAVVFPFRIPGTKHLQLINQPNEATWQRVFDAFASGRSLTDQQIDEESMAAKLLVSIHPVDQILLYIRHFGEKIQTLSLLASLWQHYQELYEQETQKIDFADARVKNLELDDKLRQEAIEWQKKSVELGLSDDEILVLSILIKHRHPRRQLFWAYQTKLRYPKLRDFFETNKDLMLKLTHTGNPL